ncbi:MAG: cache domain-containing protein [Bacteroidota bacterium]|nr:cache domain-containing protein [Bacteroidota bacterium]
MNKISTKSIQSQLILYFTIAILVPTIITSTVGVKLIKDQIITHAESKTISDLNSAREIYRNKISHIESITRLTAARSLVIHALKESNSSFLQKDLQRTLQRENLDVLTIVDKNGKVLARGRNAKLFGDVLKEDKLVKRAISTNRIVSGADIVSREYLMKESPALAGQVFMDVTRTQKAKPRKSLKETSGLMLKAAVPVFDDNGSFIGVLLGGTLLNRNFEIVDKIKETVHEKGIYKGREIGTATIFQNDLRISTNVKNADGTRAISTLVSEEVYDAVLIRGERFVGDAFVVNAWYISAYEPIRDIENNIIGILYVGVLKQPFDDTLSKAILTFLGIAMGGIILIIFIAVHQAKKISTPLRKLEEVAKKIEDGDYKQQFIVKAPREIERLSASLNQMAKQLDQEKMELEAWGEKLEKKVEARTDEIKKIHAQLFRSEKLASLGKLAAGVAHEINNPLTGILTNASLLLDDLPKEDPRHEDVDVIVKETIRCREIVKRLLDFARQTKPQKQLVDVNSIIESIILLVRNQTSFRNIAIQKNLSGNMPEIMADKDQIQQVFINIIINAAEAMSKSGTLTIDTLLSSTKDFIMIKISDTGHGIPEHLREKIFDPFYTTKENGTGLGLSISYGIIEQHGGEINVDSTIGEGTTFTIKLPIYSQESD